MARRRRTTPENVRMVLVPPEGAEAYDPSKLDPRIITLVRLLARQAAKEFVDAEWKRTDAPSRNR